MRVYASNWRKVYRAICKAEGKTAAEYAETLDLRAEFHSGCKRQNERTFTKVAVKLKNAGLIRGVWEGRDERWYRQGRVVGKEELKRAWERFGEYSPFL